MLSLIFQEFRMGYKCSNSHFYKFGIILLCINVVVSYSTGAGPQSCSSLVPFHNNIQPQVGPVPYKITVSKTTYTPREQIVGKYSCLYIIINS